jgi:putative peptidoglycan lipid II flippase
MYLFRLLQGAFSGGPVGVKQASLLLAGTALLSNILGLLRNVIFYRLIDPAQLDIYYASFRVPDFLFNVLIFGAISSAFVPLMSSKLAHGDKESAREFANQTFTWLTIIFGALAILMVIMMEPIMRLVVQGFDPERFATAVTLSRIIMVQAIFFAWSFICGGYLNSIRRFATTAFAPLGYNIAIIAGAFVAAATNIMALAYAVVLGSIIHFALQFWEMSRSGYRPQLTFRTSRDLGDLSRLMVPRSISQGVSQFALIVFTALASGLTAGSIAILSGMNDLQTTPTVILVGSLAAALFPTLAARAAQENWEEINRLLNKAFRLTFFMLIPSIMMGYILRAQIVRLYFSIGGANWELTTLAIDTFVAFLVGIIPSAFVILLSRLFYSLKDTRTPMILSAIAAVVGITWAWVSIRMLGGTVANLALASSIIATTQALLYIFALKRNPWVRLGLVSMLPRIGVYAFTGLLGSVSAWSVLQIVDWFYRTTGILGTNVVIGLFLQFVAAAAVGVLIVLSYSRLVLTEELAWIKNRNSTKTQ